MVSGVNTDGYLEAQGVLVFLHTPFMCSKDADSEIAELYIDQHRDGSICSVDLFYNRESTMFEDLGREVTQLSTKEENSDAVDESDEVM